MTGNWIVETKGTPNSNTFEISVVREDNEIGRKSYGWYGPDKMYISDSGGPCNNFVTESIWDKLVVVARDVANELNDYEMGWR